MKKNAPPSRPTPPHAQHRETKATSAASFVHLRKELARSIRQGHPWVYRDALRDPPAFGRGALVEVRGRGTSGRPLAWGYWDTESPIALRLLAQGPLPRTPADAAARIVDERLARTLSGRLARLDRARTNTFRWVHGEADELPGIHVDLYADVAVVRYDGGGARAFYADLPERLGRSAKAAGLALARVIDREERGDLGEVEVLENGLRFGVDLGRGGKGGLFLDQRDNRAFVAEHARGRRVLNLFGYTGAFSLYAAAAGATRTDTVDIAKPAIEAARRNFARNGLATDETHAGFFAQDAFAFLERAIAERRTWDLVISDPPSFAPSAKALPAARNAYTRLHRLCAQVVAPEGLFCPASCSSHFRRDDFLASVEAGVAGAGKRFELFAMRGAGFDHPVVPFFPEGDYLKLALGRVVAGGRGRLQS